MDRPALPRAAPGAPLAGGAHQIAFVVRDIRAAQRFWEGAMGVPGFALYEDIRFEELTYRGEPARFRIHLSLAYAGDAQIELIEPLEGRSIYTEFLERRGEGLHHLGFLVDDLDEAVARFEARGEPVIQSGRFGSEPGTRFAYLDTEASAGAVLEMIQLDAAGRELFERLRRGELPG